MAEEAVVQYNGVSYPLIKELTKREIFEFETSSGRTLNETPKATGGMLIAWLTLRRNISSDLTWDEFLDNADIEVDTRDTSPPPTGTSDESGPPVPTPEDAGTPDGSTSSESDPGSSSTSPKARSRVASAT